jgi:hypothetical protein
MMKLFDMEEDALLSLLFELCLATAVGILVFEYLVKRIAPCFEMDYRAPYAILLALVAAVAAHYIPRKNDESRENKRSSTHRDRSWPSSSL